MHNTWSQLKNSDLEVTAEDGSCSVGHLDLSSSRTGLFSHEICLGEVQPIFGNGSENLNLISIFTRFLLPESKELPPSKTFRQEGSFLGSMALSKLIFQL